MEVLALIPARGGSKSIPRKNIMTMIDRPLLAWSIYHAEKSKYINRVSVNFRQTVNCLIDQIW